MCIIENKCGPHWLNKTCIYNDPVKAQDVKKITDRFGGICEIYLNLIKEYRKIVQCAGWT
jgi:hypothetical protein